MTSLLPALPEGTDRRPLVVAHRGNSSVAPQNTLVALESAWRSGADAVEIDLQLTADGEIVVIHDDSVDATTSGTGRVAELPFVDLRDLDAGSWFSPHYAGQRVPTFDEVLDLLRSRPGMDLLLELKDEWTTSDAARVTGAIDAAGLAGRVVVQSFYPSTVAALRDVAPHLPRGLLVSEEHPEAVGLVEELGVACCNPSVELALTTDLVAQLHAKGLRVMVWTADETTEWAALRDRGVDAIITDRPDRLRGWLSA